MADKPVPAEDGLEVQENGGLEVSEDFQSLPQLRSPGAPNKYSNLPQPVKSESEIQAQSIQRQDHRQKDTRYKLGTHSSTQRICGLSPRWFGATVAAIAVIIVGAAVGGGLGGALSNQGTHKSAPTFVTITSTLPANATAPPSTTTSGELLDYAAATPTSVYSLAYNCTEAEGLHHTFSNEVFTVSCNTVQNQNDLVTIVAYTWQDCVEACSQMNRWQNRSDACTRLQWNAFLANRTAEGNRGGYGNCWLKRGGNNTLAAAEGSVGAVLVQA